MQTYQTDPTKISERHHKYLDILGMIWVALLVVATFTCGKSFDIGPMAFSVATIFYPITYIFADLFTEVYGYQKTRRIVWTGFFCLILVTLIAYLYSFVPPSSEYPDNDAFITVFRASPILAFAVICGFFAGELTNSYVLAKMKVKTQGKHLWARMIGSTLVGQFADNTVGYSLAFLLGGFFTLQLLPNLILSTVIFCVLWEIIALPITQRVVVWLKKAEGLDIYDRDTDFNPFKLN